MTLYRRGNQCRIVKLGNVLPMNLQTIHQHSELTGISNRRRMLLYRIRLAWPPWYWLFFSGYGHAWEKAPHPYCRQREERGKGMDRLNSATLAHRVLRSPSRSQVSLGFLTPSQFSSKAYVLVIYTLMSIFFSPRVQSFVVYHISDGERVASLSRCFLASRKQQLQ